MKRFDDATFAQVRAADPDVSTWVPANAGSGKTRVLIDRVSRLLFRGNDPEKILCLTYTKAAAAEMQNRLFARLGGWAMMPDDRLFEALRNLGETEENLTGDSLNIARRLFANALETPGGLKIQTIHSFCDTLLRRFPLEAEVSGQFEIIDERHASAMRQNILDALAERDSTRDMVRNLLLHFTDFDLDGFLDEIVEQREAFDRGFPKALCPEPEPLEETIGEVFAPGTTGLLTFWADLMRKSDSSSDQKSAGKLASAAEMAGTEDGLKKLETVLLFGRTARSPFAPKFDAFPTKKLRASEPKQHARLVGLMERVAGARNHRIMRKAFARTRALHEFAACYFREYDRRKLLGGYLTYDDLIRKTIRLLSKPGISDWILYRLDGGVDHILIDEAQDTSRRQWDIIKSVEAEFTAGESGRAGERTLFVVGDEKQSIFSFQGADPDYFVDMRDYFAQRQVRVRKELAERSLLFSFRSASPILELADAVCEQNQMTGSSAPVIHRAFHGDMPGRIDLWPYIEKERQDYAYTWHQPGQPLSSDRDVRVELAGIVAGYLKSVLADPPVLSSRENARRLSAGDVLILVQTRSVMFHALIRELKARNLPVAGADRMEVGAELAVRDILSLLRFAATPGDDLALAEALRSPLIGMSEADLFDIASVRKGSLWKEMASRHNRFPNACSILADCVEHAHLLRPYDLVERILNRHGGRQRILARLGPEAEDGIDELVNEALKYEQSGPPSVTGFLNWFELGDVDVKRQTQADLDQIRVMTVHGAKGLEAPFVILPDTDSRPSGRGGQTLVLDDGSLIWRSSQDEAIEAQVLADRANREFEEKERNRLLYVAITRASQWLLVCGAGAGGKARERSWHGRIERAMEGLDSRSVVSPVRDSPGLRLGGKAWPPAGGYSGPAKSEIADVDAVPSWLFERARPDWPGMPAVNPSGLGGDKVITPPDSGDNSLGGGREFGLQVHALLEHLPRHPKEEWERVAERIRRAEGWSEFESAYELSINILLMPELEHLFGPGSLAEVPVSAELDGFDGRRIYGIIDRLVVSGDQVLAVDYKTNADVPETADDIPDGLLRQMGAYAAALEKVYPGREISMAILWTANGSFMTLGRELVAYHTRKATAELAETGIQTILPGFPRTGDTQGPAQAGEARPSA